MSIVVLKWNPGFSSYTMARFLNDLEKCALANEDDTGMNWSIWDHDKVHADDTFYMLKVGYGQTGIVACGILTSDPYAGEDWAWRDRPTWYCDLNFEAMINPDAYPLLSSAELAKAISDFDWNGGHSGLVLTQAQGDALQHLWHSYISRQAEYFEKASDQNLFLLAKPLAPGEWPYTLDLESGYEGPLVIITVKDKDITTRIRIYNYHRILGKFGVRSWRTLRQLIYQRYPVADDLHNLCADLYRCQIEFNADFHKTPQDDDDDDEN